MTPETPESSLALLLALAIVKLAPEKSTRVLMPQTAKPDSQVIGGSHCASVAGAGLTIWAQLALSAR